MYLRTKSYGEGQPILFGSNARRTPFSVALKAEDVLADSNGKKYVPEGAFIADINGEIRILPRTRIVGNLNATSNLLTIKSPCMSFKPGDELYLYGGLSILLTGTPVEGDTIFIRINKTLQSITVGASPTLLGVCNAIAALSFPGVVLAVNNVGRIAIQSTDYFSIAVTVRTASINSTLTATSSTNNTGYSSGSYPARPFGTIQSIGSPNNNGERVVTLTDNSTLTTTLPNQLVGVAVDKLLGVYPDPLDFTDTPVIHLSPVFHADGVYESNLPYCDAQIKRELHGLNINKKFYATT